MITSALAPARITLGLEVIGKRPDGYHDIATVMQKIDVADQITLASGDSRLPDHLPPLTDPQNLVVRAVRAFQQETGSQVPFQVNLQKRIPEAAGLAGGSSDAATTLALVNSVSGSPLSPGTLHQIATTLGSDVAFFLSGAAALAQGRGDLLTSVRSMPPVSIVLVTPAAAIRDKTRTLYGRLQESDFCSGSRASLVAGSLNAGILPSPELLENTFWRPMAELQPGIASIRALMLHSGAPFVALSGAGSALYTWFPAHADARSYAEILRPILPIDTLISLVSPEVDEPGPRQMVSPP